MRRSGRVLAADPIRAKLGDRSRLLVGASQHSYDQYSHDQRGG
jgi:hypothetical protein